MSDDADVRVGTAEREQALQSLAAHYEAGRLDADEYEDRRGRAADAPVRSQLTALFIDLPAASAGPGRTSSGAGAASGAAPPPVVAPAGQSARDERRDRRREHRVGKVGGPSNRWGGLVALSSLVAVVLFFTTHTWLWFLMVPATAIIVGMVSRDD